MSSGKVRGRIVDDLYDQVSEPDEPEEGEVSEMSDEDGHEAGRHKGSSRDHKKSKKKKKDKKKKKKQRRRRSSSGESDSSPTKAKRRSGSGDDEEGSTDKEGGDTPEVLIIDDYENGKKKSRKDKKKKSLRNLSEAAVDDDDHDEVLKLKSSRSRQKHSESPSNSRGRRGHRKSPSVTEVDDLPSKGRRRNETESPSRDDPRGRDRGERSRKRAASRSRSRSRSRERSPGQSRKFRRRQDSQSPVAKRSRDEKEKGSKNLAPHEEDGAHRERSSKKKEVEEEAGGSRGALSLSIEETNKLRAKLGLKPLQVASDFGASNQEQPPEDDNLPGTLIPNSNIRHLPALNITEKTHMEKMRDKLEQRRLKRQQEAKLLSVKTLGESDSEDESAGAWVKRQKKKISAKEEAEKREKILADLDDEFGVKSIVEEEAMKEKIKRYKSSDLRGLKVEHSADRFQDGSTIVLTLKDAGVLDEDAGDTLVNVNIMDREKTERNLKNLRDAKLGGYNPYEEEIDESTGDLRSKGLLSKYDEEISGKESKKSFEIGRDGTFNEDEVMRQERERIRQRLKKTTVESLETPTLRVASDFYTAEETSVKFKKVKKKKVKRKMLKADDLLPLGEAEPASGGIRKPRPASPVPMAVDEDDYMNIRIDDEEDDFGLQKALAKTRRLKDMLLKEDSAANRIADIASSMPSEENLGGTSNGAEFIGTFADDVTFDNNIILNETSEFCRNLGAWRASEISSGLGEAVPKELLEFESSLKPKSFAAAPVRRGGWEEVVENDSDEPMDEDLSGDSETEGGEKKKGSFSILDNEPKLTGGLGAALKLAAAKGYLEGKGKEMRSSNLSHLSAKNYTVEDKMRDDDRSSRRDRYNGPTQAFTEKSGYVPNVKLEYIDDLGRNMNEKEAFRYLSHRFHGKGSGKMKTEKRMKKIAEETVLKGMSSTDTPLQTLQKLRDKQKESATPYIVLTGNKINPTDLRK